MQIKGSYLDGKTSKRHNARLEVSSYHPQQILLYVEQSNAELPTYQQDHKEVPLKYSEMKISSRLGNTPREISFGQNELFVTGDNDAIDNLTLIFKETVSTPVLHKLESNVLLVLCATLTTIAVIWASVVYGIPKSANYIAHQLPDFTSEKLGSSLTMLDETLFSPSELSEVEQRRLRTLIAPYLEHYSELKPNVEFRSGMPANAFALPGGEIVFTDDFITLVEDDNELLAVMFHELGHLKYKHITRRLLQDSMITLMVIFVTGDVDTIDLVTGLPTLMLDLSYSRQFEIEADLFALEELQRFDISPEHFASIMLKLDALYANEKGNTEDEKGANLRLITSFLSTHPPTESRIKLAEEYTDHSSQEK